MDVIRKQGPVSRAQLARITGLSKPTVSQTLAALEASSVVRARARTSGHVGSPALLYEVDPSAGWVVGVDVGHAWARAAIADITGSFVARRDERTRRSSGAALVRQIGMMAHSLAAEAGVDWSEVTSAVVGSPGVLQAGQHRVSMAANLPGWGRPGLVDAVRAELGTRVELENDVNLAAIGEQWAGRGGGVDNFVFISVGTGVGMGVVIDGRLYRGARGGAGEIGYLPLCGDPSGHDARRVGALEAAAGSRAVVAHARALGMPAPVTAKQVFDRARRGDERGLVVVSGEAERIALAIAAVCAVLDPELVIVGGGIGRNADVLLGEVTRSLRRLSPFRPRLEVSTLGDDAVLHGAVATALGRAQEQVLHARAASTSGAGSPRRTDELEDARKLMESAARTEGVGRATARRRS